MKKLIIFILAVVLSAFFFVQTGLAAGAEYKIRCSTGLPDYHPIAKEYIDLANLIKEKTNGRVEVELYFNGQLYKDNQVIEAIQTGAVEAGCAYSFALATMIPEFEIFNMPLLFDTTAEIEKVLNSDIGEMLSNKMESKGLKLIAWFPWPQEDIGFVSTKEVKLPGDLKGLSIRGLSQVSAEWYRSLGAEAAYISGAEVFMAFQRGTLDAGIGQISGSILRKQYEVAPYMTILSTTSMLPLPVMNKRYFDKLPEDIQQAILEAGAEMSAKSAEYVVEEVNKLKKKAAEVNLNIYYPTEEELILWRRGMRDIWRKAFAKKPGALVLADEVLDLLGKAEDFK